MSSLWYPNSNFLMKQLGTLKWMGYNESEVVDKYSINIFLSLILKTKLNHKITKTVVKILRAEDTQQKSASTVQ